MAYERFSREINPGWEDRLRKYVSVNRLSYKEIMTSLQISRGTVSNLLNGKHKPSSDVVQKITQAYNDLDINWLLYGEGNQPQNGNSVTHSVTPLPYKSSVTEYNTTAPPPPPPPPPPEMGYQHTDIAKLMQIIDNQGKTIDNQGQTINQLIEQNKMLTELIKLGKYNAVTFTGPQAFPKFAIDDSHSVTLAVTAERIAA